MAPFDRSCATSYISSVLYEFSNYLTLKNLIILKFRLAVGHTANLCTICTSLRSTDICYPVAIESDRMDLHTSTSTQQVQLKLYKVVRYSRSTSIMCHQNWYQSKALCATSC